MNYTELKTAISDWMHRNDLASNADVFISMAEARANRNLRSNYMERSGTAIGNPEPLPVGWLGFKSVRSIGAGYSVPLEYASSQKISALAGGIPVYYTIKAGLVEFIPAAPGSTIEWTFYESIPALSATNLTNWLIDRHPDYYLMSCLQLAGAYSLKGQDQQIEMALQGIEAQVNRAARNAMSGPITVIRG